MAVRIVVLGLCMIASFLYARNYQRRTGDTLWHLPPLLWGLLGFFGLLVVILIFIAKRTTKPRGEPGIDPGSATPDALMRQEPRISEVSEPYPFGERLVWVPNRFYWLAFAVLGLGAVAFVIGVGVRDAVNRPGGVSGGFYVWLVVSLAWSAFLYRFILWPRLIADKDGLTVRNPLGTQSIAWSEIASITCREERPLVHVTRTDGSDVVVRALAAPVTQSGNKIGLDHTQRVVEFLEAWRQSEMPASSSG